MIALLSVWFAARQAVIADEKLRLDTFEKQYERKFALYEAIMQQGDRAAGFSSRFKPFLAFKPSKRSWWLRWP
jgi:hypothetical protein